MSSRILSASSKFQKTTIIEVYAPTNIADENEKEEFYSSLQTVVNNAPNRDILLVTGNLNSKVGLERTGREKSDPMEL